MDKHMQNEKELIRLRGASCLRRELPEPGARNFACGANYLAPGWFNFACGANYPHHVGNRVVSDAYKMRAFLCDTRTWGRGSAPLERRGTAPIGSPGIKRL